MTKSGIITEVRRRTQRSSSDVTAVEVEGALEFLTLSIPTLFKECTTTTVVGQANYDLKSLPKLFKQLTAVNCSGGDSDTSLIKMSEWREYQNTIVDETTSDYDQPEKYLVYNDFLYVYPTPDDSYALTLFSKVYEDDSDNIMLGDEYREPLYELACFETFKNLGLGSSDQARSHFENYLRWQVAFEKLEVGKIDADNVVYTDI